MHALFNYDPETGLLTRRITCGRMVAGSAAGNRNSSGYVVVSIDGHEYRVHRAAWAMMTGGWPVAEVDHVNCVRHDNRWSNLREATRAQNAANLAAFSTNKSGRKGVCWCKRARRWKASIFLNNRHKHLGYFDTVEAASGVYESAAKAARGEFARA